ncbi:hypothetical protein BGZ51_003487 [Haplosporangium sp. Z 767]|nr:hypothetical protein BGZ51_003487 [Haplosporangium sp. Z 767]KAF9185626.1 hypothetical protein BGZ50_002981 [Haplosporangium sp. Z 11]
MASPSTWSTALRLCSSNSTRRRPLSLQLLPTTSSTTNTSSVRWASIAPYVITQYTCYSPPPPPMTLEQVKQHQKRKQQSLLEEQMTLEQSQRMRQQLELQLELAKHRNAILEQQQLLQKQQEQQHKQRLEEEQVRRRDQEVSSTSTTTSTEKQQHKESQVQAKNTDPSCPTDQEQTQAQRRPQYVATQHRSIFGYRGPEHRMTMSTTASTDALIEEEHKHIDQVVVPVRIPFMITAENRVRLTMLDYTPKQIDAMTPEQAHAILARETVSRECKAKAEAEAETFSEETREESRKVLSPTETNKRIDLEHGQHHALQKLNAMASSVVRTTLSSHRDDHDTRLPVVPSPPPSTA